MINLSTHITESSSNSLKNSDSGMSSSHNVEKIVNSETTDTALLIKSSNYAVNEASSCFENNWYIDSGCSRHMTGNKSLLSLFKSHKGRDIFFGNKNRGEVLGSGHIKTGSLSFEDVNLIDNLKYNLLSVSQMGDKGFGLFFTKDSCKIVDSVTAKKIDLLISNNSLLMAKRVDNTYIVNLSNEGQLIQNVISPNSLTHQHFNSFCQTCTNHSTSISENQFEPIPSFIKHDSPSLNTFSNKVFSSLLSIKTYQNFALNQDSVVLKYSAEEMSLMDLALIAAEFEEM